jgi:hypothetical protein
MPLHLRMVEMKVPGLDPMIVVSTSSTHLPVNANQPTNALDPPSLCVLRSRELQEPSQAAMQESSNSQEDWPK